MSDRVRLAVLSTGRQDYGLLRSTIRALRDDARFELLVYAGGMHLSRRFGNTVDQLRADDCAVSRELAFLAEPPDPVHDSAAALSAVAEALRADRPDALLLVGDRSETLAAAFAATLERVPLVHVHGGEESEGAIDNALRHAVTKLAHLHLVSHPVHRRRVIQMGEPPENVIVVGAPGLDHLYRDDLARGSALADALGARVERPLMIVTVHPTTLSSSGDAVHEVRETAAALDAFTGTVVISQPNADAGGAAIREFWSDWARSRPRVILRDALGDRLYWSLLRQADVMVGNSSSGIIEAPAADLPVVNIGDRQRGRLRSPSTIDAPADREAIAAAITRALTPEHRSLARAAERTYPAGPAAPRIVAAIAEWAPRRAMRKTFYEAGT